jgi:hypothetical protein
LHHLGFVLAFHLGIDDDVTMLGVLVMTLGGEMSVFITEPTRERVKVKVYLVEKGARNH